MITLGIDFGTRYLKACIVSGGLPVGIARAEIAGDPTSLLDQTINESMRSAGLRKGKLSRIAATGYGAALVKQAHIVARDERCMAQAVSRFDPASGCVVDIGGLFIRAAIISKGRILESTENEKCAAGSGRFIETVAQAMNLPLAAVDEQVRQSTNPRSITASCAVFAESEVISYLNAGYNRSDVLAGVLSSITAKTITLIKRLGITDSITIVGGVARIDAIRSMLCRAGLSAAVIPGIDPQLAVAFGAALLAAEKHGKR